MLLEGLSVLGMRAVPGARRLGLDRELAGLLGRALRQRRAWTPHRQACHAAVVRAMEATPGRTLAVVLGAGWLLEVPLAPLARAFGRVVLVDAVLTPRVRLDALRAAFGGRRCGRVETLAADGAGILAEVARLRGGCPEVPDPAPLPDAVAAADLVISANLLSQLPQAPRAWLDRHGVAPERQDRLARALIDAHLNALAACPGTVCLLSDFEREERSLSGAHPPWRMDLLHGARPKVDGPRWWWDLAPPGEEGADAMVRHRMMGGVLRKA